MTTPLQNNIHTAEEYPPQVDTMSVGEGVVSPVISDTPHTEEGVHEDAHTDSHDDGHVPHATTLFAEPIVQSSVLPITNALVTSWIAVLIILLLSLTIRRKISIIPGKLQHVFELIVEGALNLCDQVTNSRTLSKKIFPLAFSLFLFVLINNWLGLLPLTAIGTIQVMADGSKAFVPFLRGGTADVNTTLALGLVVVLGANLFGAFSIGIWKTVNKYLNFRAIGKSVKNIRKDKTGIVVGLVSFFVGILEIIGEVAKVASLSFRLFGNIFAGEVLLVSMSVLVAYFVPIPFLFLEILVGVIQALIFSMLTLVYFTIASHDHGDEGDHSTEGAH